LVQAACNAPPRQRPELMSGEGGQDGGGFTAAYQNAAKEGTAHVRDAKSGVNVDHTKAVEDPTLPFRERIAARLARSVAGLEAGGLKRPRCLDVGCSTGGDLKKLREALGEGSSAQLVGVDLLEAQLPKAREALPEAEFKHGDVAARLPFEDGEFDTLQASRLLIHMPDPGKAIDEMIRVMKPGALGVLAESDMDLGQLMTGDDRLRAINGKKTEHTFKMCANPRAASTTYRYLLAHPAAESVALDAWACACPVPPFPEHDRMFLQKLVESGSLPAEDLEYYMGQATGRAAAEGNFVTLFPMFEVSFRKKALS